VSQSENGIEPKGQDPDDQEPLVYLEEEVEAPRRPPL